MTFYNKLYKSEEQSTIYGTKQKKCCQVFCKIVPNIDKNILSFKKSDSF